MVRDEGAAGSSVVPPCPRRSSGFASGTTPRSCGRRVRHRDGTWSSLFLDRLEGTADLTWLAADFLARHPTIGMEAWWRPSLPDTPRHASIAMVVLARHHRGGSSNPFVRSPARHQQGGDGLQRREGPPYRHARTALFPRHSFVPRTPRDRSPIRGPRVFRLLVKMLEGEPEDWEGCSLFSELKSSLKVSRVFHTCTVWNVFKFWRRTS